MKHIRRFLCLLALFASCMQLSAQSRLGANNAAPKIAFFMNSLTFVPETVHVLTEQETGALFQLAASNKINVFELIDCVYRTVSVRNVRVAITGDSLRKLETRFDFGGERILAILPIGKLDYLETGALFESDDKALDIFLVSTHESRMEIGTALYQRRFGFASVAPLVFSAAYGITVKKLFITTTLEKLELYEPGKGAIYVGGMSRPKRWNLDVVTEKAR